jgi:hypothetical protein
MKSAGFFSEKGLEALQDKGVQILRWTGRSSEPLMQNPREAERRAWSSLVERLQSGSRLYTGFVSRGAGVVEVLLPKHR